MSLFLVGIAILILGYFTYGRVVERILAPDDRKTPALAVNDGVDYLPLPSWKNMLIQLLNIAGIGPVIGVIFGIRFGSVVFVAIPIGCVLMGAVHDYVAGMCSLRNNGANLPLLVHKYLGARLGRMFLFFMCLSLLLVVAVFINVPAHLIEKLGGGAKNWFYIALVAIFIYYIIATLFPVDKIIGRIYPIFGAILIVGTLALFLCILYKGYQTPNFLTESEGFKENMFTAEKNQPVIPLLFITIACGIISGFHATQSPIVARTMKSERESKPTFFGMMIIEGLIGMIWAAGAMALYNIQPELMSQNPNGVLIKIANFFFSDGYTNVIIVISVIILAITSGDTALRSLRLAMAEHLHMGQKTIRNRLAVCLICIILVSGLLFWSNLSEATFGFLWNYFTWFNQLMALFALATGTVFLFTQHKAAFITIFPFAFITFIDACYILWISPAHGGPAGFGLQLNHALLFAGAITYVCTIFLVAHGKKMSNDLLTEQKPEKKP